MPRHTKDVRKIYILANSHSELFKRIKETTELWSKEGLLTRSSSSTAYNAMTGRMAYNAIVTGYVVLKEW